MAPVGELRWPSSVPNTEARVWALPVSPDRASHAAWGEGGREGQDSGLPPPLLEGMEEGGNSSWGGKHTHPYK